MNEDRVEGAARNIGGKVEEAVGRFTGDAATQVRGAADQAFGRIQNSFGGAVDSASELGDRLSNSVREKPMQALLVAGAVGFVIGFLVRR